MTNKMIILLLITAAAISCNKHTTPACIKAKIIRVTCASTVMQVLNDDSLGEDNWTNIFDSARYNNVFNVSNPCKLASEHKPGDTVYITIGTPVAIDCIRCALYDAAPATSYNVSSIENYPCQNTIK